MIHEHISSWLGYPVHPLSFDNIGETIPDLSQTICRLHIGWDDEGSFAELFERFLKLPNVDRTPAVIIGAFSGDDSGAESTFAVKLLVDASNKLKSLKGIFLGDIIGEENEISWINQSDVSPLLTAYPQLEHLGIRGGTALIFNVVSHANLQSLVIETGGLPSNVIEEIVQSKLPALKRLELWLGSDQYGWDGSIATVQPLMDAALFPNLRYLGLKNSEIQDDIATHIVSSSIIKQLEILDLSMGALTDVGGAALLNCPALKNLQALDLHFHYLSEEMTARIQSAFPRADVSERQEEDGEGEDLYRPISVSE